MKKAKENIVVCVRMRPLLPPYEDEIAWDVNIAARTLTSVPTSLQMVPPTDASALSLASLKERELRRRYTDMTGPQSFTFDYVYGPSQSSLDIYQDICGPIVESTLQGYNAAILMYGQTTSGKTYTMLGVPELPGILPCAMRHVFQQAAERSVWVSYLEIYNEQINDLLNPGASNLRIKEDKVDGVQIQGLTIHQVWSFDQVIMIMNFGEEKRMYRETSLNDHSSRSHTIFRVYIENKEVGGKRTVGCLNLVDLAGSERLNDMEVKGPEVVGETGYINKSLFVLANVVNKLAEGKKQHVPYRDSKLTRILSQALGGNSLAAIVCTISPAAINFHQTLSTLRFAMRAKIVQNVPQVNQLNDGTEVVAQYKLEILRLKGELDQAQQAFARIEQKNRELAEQLGTVLADTVAPSGDLLHKLNTEKQLRDNLEKELAEQRKLFERTKAEHEQTQRILQEVELTARRGPVSHISSETNFIENMVISIHEELGDEISNDSEWKSICHETNEAYKKELVRIQDKFTEMLSGGLKKIAVRESPKNLFVDIHPNFSSIFEEPVQPERAELIINKLKHQHEYFSGKVEARYDQARMTIQEYYETDPSQLNEQLEYLKHQYEDTVRRLETEFIETLNKLDQLLVEDSGVLYMWGSGKDGRLGNNTESSFASPTEILPKEIQKIVCGYHHSAAINTSGQLLTWGRGLFGQLGHNSTESLHVPTPVTALANLKVIQVACGWQHTIALTDTQRVFSWGYGEDGQLGHDDFKDYLSPNELRCLASKKPTLVACGHSHSACITEESLFAWGCNPDARCFVETSENPGRPVQIELDDRPIHLSLGVNHSGVVTSSGKLYMAGSGQDGQLGIDTSGFRARHEVRVRNPAMVACGDSFTLVLDVEGRVFSFGKATHGRLGLGRNVEEKVVQPREVPVVGVTKISAGCRHASAIVESGDLFVWGFNFYQQLGVGDDKDYYEPVVALSAVKEVSCGYFHSGCICLHKDS